MQGEQSPSSRGAGLSGTGLQILSYLVDHPGAGDTAEGIVDWWLAQGDVSIKRDCVEQALDELLQRDLITVVRAADSRSHYRLNAEWIEDIRFLLKQGEQCD